MQLAPKCWDTMLARQEDFWPWGNGPIILELLKMEGLHFHATNEWEVVTEPNVHNFLLLLFFKKKIENDLESWYCSCLALSLLLLASNVFLCQLQ